MKGIRIWCPDEEVFRMFDCNQHFWRRKKLDILLYCDNIMLDQRKGGVV